MTNLRGLAFAGFLLATVAPGTAGAAAVDDINAGLAAFQRAQFADAVDLFSRAITSNELTGNNLAAAFSNRGLARAGAGDQIGRAHV